MRPQDELLYLCCVQQIDGARRARIADLARQPALPWGEIFKLARDHGVAPLVYHDLQVADAATHIPAAVAHSFALATYTNTVAKARRADKLAAILAQLDALGVDALGIKSVALDLALYDQAWYTSALDTDLVLRVRRPPMTAQARAAVEACCNGTGIEYEFDAHHDLTLNGLLPVDFAAIWRDATPVTTGGHMLYLMRPEDMLLSVCINSARKRFFRLRSLADLAATVARYPELDWNFVATRAAQWSCRAIVYTALRTMEQATGCPLPAAALPALALAPAQRWLLDRSITHLVRHTPLAAMSFYTGEKYTGPRLSWSLALTYATYHPRQGWRFLQRGLMPLFLPRHADNRRARLPAP
jgi:hypothetical protein